MRLKKTTPEDYGLSLRTIFYLLKGIDPDPLMSKDFESIFQTHPKALRA